MRCVLSFIVAATLCSSGLAEDAEKPPEMVTIKGQVVDAQKTGVGGARVWAGIYRPKDGVYHYDPIDVRADSRGNFSFEMLKTQVGYTKIIASDQTRIGFCNWDDVQSYSVDDKQQIGMNIKLAETKVLKLSLTGADSQPVAGARVGVLATYLKPYTKGDAAADVEPSFSQDEIDLPPLQTDAQGNAALLVPADAGGVVVYAFKPGQGFDYRCAKAPGNAETRRDLPTDGLVAMQLGPTRKVTILAREPDKKPIAGLNVHLWLLQKPGEPDDFNFSYTQGLYRTTTGADGIAHFDDLPVWDKELIFWPYNEEFSHERIVWNSARKPDGKIRVTLTRLVPVSGTVELPDGQPASGIKILVNGATPNVDDFRGQTTSDEAGKFKIAVSPDQLYVLAVEDETWGAAPIDGLAVHEGKPVTGLKFKLRPATRISGRLVTGPDRRPVPGQRVRLVQNVRAYFDVKDADLPRDPRGINYGPFVDRQTLTDEEGRFEFHVGPGKYYLDGPQNDLDNIERFEVVGQSEMKFDLTVPLKGEKKRAPPRKRKKKRTNDPPRPDSDVAPRPAMRKSEEFTMKRLLLAALAAALCCGGFDAHGKEPGGITIDGSDLVEIRGQVVDPQGAAVAGARVSSSVFGLDPIEVRADAQGKFTIKLPKTSFPHSTIIACDPTRLGIGKAPTGAEHPGEIELKLAATKVLKLSLTDVDSRPVAGARTGLFAEYLKPRPPRPGEAEADAPPEFSPSMFVMPPAETDAKGSATLLVPADVGGCLIYVYKPGQGFDYRVVKPLWDPEKSHHLPADGRVAMQLGPTRKLAIHLRDSRKKPVAGLELWLPQLQKPGEPEAFDFFWASTLTGLDRATSDAAGVVHFDNLPAWVGELTFLPEDRNFEGPVFGIAWDPAKQPDGNLRVTLEPHVPISGSVELPDGGPAKGIDVLAGGSGISGRRCKKRTTTDEAGKFEIAVAPDQLDMLVIDDEKWAATAIDGLVVQPGMPVTGLKFKLRPATRISGRVTLGPQHQPLADEHVTLMQNGRSSSEIKNLDLPPHPPGWNFIEFVERETETDSEGRYEFHVGPGKYLLFGPPAAGDQPQQGEAFEVVGQSEMTFDITVPLKGENNEGGAKADDQ